MSKKVIVTGATGLIGKELCSALSNRGYDVTIFTRDVENAKKILGSKYNYVKWNYKNPNEWFSHLENKDALIHLAGANLFAKRWNKKYKDVILESRQLSTKNLISAIGQTKNKVKDFICSSGVGYYGSRGDEILTETSSIGNDFIANVVYAWETEAAKAQQMNIRTIMLRQGIVLSNKGGALSKLLPSFNLFIGGALGNGQQWIPWIHIDDIISIYLFLLDDKNISGPVNAVSPENVRMNEFAKMLGNVLHRPSIFKVPEFALRLAVGEAASAILSSQRVVPQKLIENGFNFKFEKLEDAFKDLLKSK